MCSNMNMSMFLVPIFDTSYFRDFGNRNFRLSYSSAKLMPILNFLSVIFHQFVCKFCRNLVSKLGLILYIDLKNWVSKLGLILYINLTSFKQQFLIDHYWRTITKKILVKICSILVDLG